jgi:hypothetical protein
MVPLTRITLGKEFVELGKVYSVTRLHTSYQAHTNGQSTSKRESKVLKCLKVLRLTL